MSHVRMQPYGIRSEYRDEAFGPTTKFGGRSRHRKAWRRLMHRQGRIDGRAEVESQVQEMHEEQQVEESIARFCGCELCQ